MYNVKLIDGFAYLYYNETALCIFASKYDGPPLATAIAKLLNDCADLIPAE